MKFKREIIAIILIICMLFTISAISAADSSTGAVSATNVTVEAASDGVANDNNLATENNVEILGEGEGSFIDLSDELSGKSEYKLERDYVYNIATDTGLSDGIVISNSITIDGQGHTIDAKGQSRIFYMYTSDSIDVTLKNITFVNGKSTWGGALVWYCYYGGNGNVINCTFINNTASGGDGGAIYNWYGLSNIVNSTFLNTFDSTSTVYLYSTSVTNCIFINNTQMDIERDGGTINANNNWFGNTVDNKDESPNIGSGVTVNNWYYLDLELDHENGIATVSLNNLYENGVVSSNGDYALPSIKFNVIGKNIAVPDSVTLENGEATISYQPTDAYSLTINYNGVELTREIKPTFKSLNDKIDSGTNQITLDQDYEYDSTKDSSLTRGIEFAKDMTIDGQGHIIDAKQSSNIFYFNDDTDSYSLTLKNIIFANATGTDGAAVYFKGKKIEIINCTFINNAATSQGDAIYIADASSNDNKITESLFTGNTGLNSIVYVNLIPSNSKLNLDNSIFVKNDATYNVKGTSNVILEYNWLGNTIENYDDNAVAKVDGVTLNNWLFLKIDATAAITGEAILSLNDLYDGSDVSTYDGYSLKPITFALSGSNARTAVSSITIDGNGQATYQFRMYKTTASLTVTHEDIVTNKELEYTIVDDGSFKALNDKIWFSSANDVIELTHDYVYSDSDTITDGILIPRTLTINGNGHKIDAKGKTRIFDIYRGVSNVNINDINFVNAKSTSGSVITIEYGADNVNIKNCNFTNNTATNYAGAIDCIGDYCTIDNCNFIYNTAASKAGAIRYYHDTQAYIKNSNFINNTVDEGGNGGGAIYDDDGKISISKSTFFNNSAKNMLGGTIYSKKAITISDSIILNSTGNYDIYDASGITIQNSWVGNTFDNYNTNPNVYYLSSYYSSWLYLNIKFYEDFAVVSLNEVYVASSGSSSIYSNYNLPEITLNINSTSLDLGGIDKITLDANGQAIVPYTKISEDAKLTVGNDYVSLTKECKVGDFDCLQNLIDSSTGNTIELTRNYTFIDGVDTLINGISITRDITIDGKGFTIDGSNLARILYITTNGVTLKNINFVNGYASHGGAIYNNGGSGFELINCTFENNVAYNNPGGAIYTYSNGVNNFINCTFIGNKMTKSGQYGGAIYIYEYSGRNNFIGCTFINNSAYYGGAIATASGKAITNVDKSVFVTNTANYYPSIYIKGGTSAEFYLKNSIIFSKGFTTDSSTQVYVANNLGAGDVDYNWWMHTSDNYKQNGYIRYSGGGLTVNKWLYLDLTCENEVATISFNNLYDKSTTTSSTYYGELPQITFDLSAVNAIVDSSVTLNKNGQGEVEYSLTDQTGSLTATYDVVSITKSLTYDDSFTTLQGKINRASEGSELVLTHGYTYDSTKDATLLDGIVIDKDLTIDGQGYTIDANNAARIFNIDDNTKNIVLKNIKFINAVGDNGAAINANCNNMEIINCTFENDQATANGDAIYLVANGCEITESIFINNIGTVSTVYLDSESDDATFNIANSILVNNGGTNVVKAKGDLTAEYNWWGNTVDNTGDLSNGLAQKWYVLEMTVDDAQSIASISLNNLNDGTTYENYALPTITLNIQATNANTRKDEVTLDENGDATVGYIVTDGSGIGTLTASYNGVSITKDINYNIDSDYSFKALKRLIDQANDNDVITLTHDYEYVVGYDDITTGSDAAITAGIDITQNNLTINGNGYTIDAKEKTRIFNVGVADHLYASNVTIKNTTFVNGKISGQGGAIRWYGWNGTLINCTFEDNTADNNYGGAVYWYAQYGNITNCTFKNNVVTGYYQGGAIYVQSKNVNVVNSTFIENKASNGGSIYINAENVTVINSTFVKSTAGNGGAIGVGKSNVIINNSTFTSNEASTYGGAVYLSSGNNIDIVGSTFNDNKATSYAGAIYSSVKFNIKNSTFKGNKANSYGGAIYYANGAGGTIYNTTFIDNSANKGGAIFTYAGVIDINKTDFINNTAQGSSTAYAGAIYDQSSDKLSIENSNFIGNYVKSGGNSAAYAGAIYTSYGEISITNSTFNKNSIENLGSGSCYGSVICWYNNAKGNIINSSFLNNHGKSSVSAAMYGDSAEVNITNSIFLNNTYGDSNTWRVIYRSVGTFNFTDCWFGNTVKNSGEDMGTPSGTGITKNNILELATVHDEYMAVGEDNQIKFVFQSRDSVIYDASKLPKINLTLSSVNGNLDKNSAAMDETILFNAKQFGPASITAKYNGIELTEDLYAKDKPTITVEEPIVVHVGESIGVNVIELIPSDASLSFSSIDGDEIISVTYNGYVEGLKEGTSTLYIKYNGNENYSPATVEVPVTVIKYNTQINVRIDTTPIDNIGVDYGADPQSITISFATDDPNPQYGEFDLEYKSNDTNVAVFTPNPTVINFANAGTANVTFYFEGSNRYNGCEKNITVTVRKVDSSVVISNDVEFDYLASGTTTLTLVGADSVSISVVGHDEAVIGYDDVTGVVTVSGLDVGSYTLKVTTTPDGNHNSVDATAAVTVNKIDSSLEFSGNVVFDYLGTGSTTLINIVGCRIDLVNISVVGHDEAVIGYDDVTGVVTVSGLDVGSYTLKVTTTPDGNHNSVDATADVTVNKIDSSVGFSGNVVFDYLGAGSTTLVDFVGCSVDLVNISVVGHDEAVIGYDDVTGVVSVSGLDAGTYALKVTTTPDGNHNSVDATADVTVNKIDSSVGFSGEVVFDYLGFGSTTLVDFVGCSVDLVNISVLNHNEAVISYDSASKVINVSGLDAGTYTLKVTTTPDGNHKSVDVTSDVTVNKIDSSLEFSGNVVFDYLGTGSTTLINIVGCRIDLVNISVVGHDEAVIGYDDVTGVVTVSGLDAGSYTLKVTSTPDGNHNSVDATVDVTVNKIDSSVGFSGSVVFDYLESGSTTLTLVGCSVDLVNISVVGHDEAVIGYDSASKVISISGLDAGTYTLKVETTPDDNHLSVDKTTDITVNKIDSSVIFSNEITFAYEDEGSTIATCTGCTIDIENVTIINHPEAVIKVEDNKITVSGLDENVYTLKVITTPDKNHKSIETTLKVTVSGISPKMEMQFTNITVGEKETVFITMGTDATGIVNITIHQGNEIVETKNITINNGFNKTEFTKLKVGEYTITAHYYGNLNYNVVTLPGEFTVHPVYNLDFNAEVDDTVCGNTTNITVNMSPDATGSIQIGSIVETIKGPQTVIALPVQNTAGKNHVTVKYIPDKNSVYGEAEIIVYYNVAKKSSEITIDDISNIKVGDVVTIVATADSGAEVVVYLNGEKLTSNVIENIAAGSYTIVASAGETDQYLASSANKTFTVSKHDVDISVSGTPAKVGEISTVTVTTDADMGIVVINVNGTEYSLDLGVSKTLDVVMSNVGSVPLTAKYVENYKYNAKDADAAVIVVSDKAKSDIVVQVPENIKVGDVVTINVTSSNSELEVTINGEKQTVAEGKVTFTASKAGIYNIIAKTNETSDIYGDIVFASFEVAKKEAVITIAEIAPKKVDDDVVVEVSSYDGANVVVYVDGVKQTLTDGKVTLKATAGSHTIIASVDETDEYLAASANKTFTVTKYDVDISVSGTPAKVGEISTVSVTTDVDMGIVVINVNGTEYSLDLSVSKTLDVVMSDVGSVPLTAKYLENYKYNAKDADAAVIVVSDKAKSDIVVQVPENIKVGDVVTINVTSSNSELEVTINGEKQTVSDGKITFTASQAGIYNIVAKTNETSEIYGEVRFESFEVVKNTAEITIADITGKKAGDNVTVVVEAYPDAAIVLYVDGEKLDSNVIENITAGTHTIVASVAETGKYLAATANKTFTVTKYDVDIAISGTHVNIGEKSVITIDANVSEGIVIVNVNGVEYSIDLAKNNTFEVLMDKVGGIPLNARYLGTDKYNAKDAKASAIMVSNKPNSNIKIEIPENIKVGDVITINVTTSNPELDVQINGEKQTVADGKITFTASKAGIYDIVAFANETKDYFGEIAYGSFDVAKKASEITIAEIAPKMVDDDVVVEVSSYEGADIVVYVDGVKQTLSEGKVTIKATAGAHTIVAGVSETDEYLASNANRTFTVSKYDVDIKVSGTPVNIGEKSLITVDANVSEGIVIVKVEDREYSLNLSNGNTLEIVMNKVGSAPLSAKYLENYKYNANDTQSTIEVGEKQKSSIIIQVNEVAIVGDEMLINVTTNGDNLTVSVLYDGKVQKTANGNFIFTPLKDGVYTIIAKTTENETVYGAENTTSFAALNRTKEVPIINISQIDNVKVGEEITFTVNATAGGEPVVKINDETITPTGDVYRYTPQKGGLFVLTVETPENERYTTGVNITTFTVDKKHSKINITVDGTLEVDKLIKVDIESYDGADIEAFIDGKSFDWEMANKYGSGDHIIIATVAENDQYYGATANYTFNVAKKSSNIHVGEDSVTVGQKATIDITLPRDATGIVIIDVNGTEYSLNISQARSIEIVMNAVGDIPFTAKYLGDDKYLPSNESNRILVNDKTPSNIVIADIGDVYAGDNVDVEVTSTSDAVLEVYLDGVKQTLDDGKFTINNITSGPHVIEVLSPETSEFKYNSTSKIIKADKKESEVSIVLPESISIGRDVEINITSTSDAEIVVYVDGARQNLSEGKLIIKATAGVHTIVASVGESDMYLPSDVNKSFTVDKLDAQIAVSGENIFEGQNTKITIDTELDEGIVVVKINDTEIAVDLTKAKSVEVKLNNPGTYELSASYLGSDIYNPAVALNSTIEVAKKQTPDVNVTIPEIKANETESISISIPNATGDVHVIVDGVDEIIPLDENGNATFTLSNMTAGKHSMVIVYTGDDENEAVIKSVPFTVTKQTSEANISIPSDIKEGENATVKVEIPGATGEAAIIVDGVEQKVKLENGTIEYPLANLSAGNHSVVVIYPGDETHDAVYNASSFNVEGKPVIVPVESKFSDIAILDNLTISITLKDENGNVIMNAPIIYTINGGDAKTVYTTENGTFIIPGENGAVIAIKYEGNETVMATNTTLTLNNTVTPSVVRVGTKFNFTSVLMIKGYAVDVKAGEKGFEFITVLTDTDGNPLANKTVQLAVNSKVYNQVTNSSGAVHYFFNMVRAGRYTMTYIFLGDGTNNSTLSSACVDLDKKPITINANSKSFKATAKTKKYTLKLSTIVGSSADGMPHLRTGKKVTLTVNGVKYTGKTDSKGKVTFNLKLTRKAKYIAKIDVEEDSTYTSATKKVIITIK